MLRIFGIRAMVGHFIINNAIAAFNKTVKALENGMIHLRSEVEKHQENVRVSQEKIDELNDQIRKADRFAANIKQLIGD
jgi:SMC interacting uncharacterized protein involved in chromosome segregation